MIKKILNNIQKYCIFMIPTLTVCFSIFLTILPYKLNNLSLLMPYISISTIYFWSIYFPQALPYPIIFLLGLFEDVMESHILGLNAICFLLFQAITKSQRKYIVNRDFIVVWAGFMLFSGIYCLVNKFSLDANDRLFCIFFGQWLITILVYVPIHWLLSKLNNLKLLNK